MMHRRAPNDAASPASGDGPIRLPTPAPGRREAERFVVDHLSSVVERRGGWESSSSRYRGGRDAAEQMLARFDVSGYRDRRRLSYPQSARVTSGLSPYIRHGLLSLHRLWNEVSGPEPDVAAFRHALLQVEYGRQWYARLGVSSGLLVDGQEPERSERQLAGDDSKAAPTSPAEAGGVDWDRAMGCVELALGELEDDGWSTDETRRWLAVDWATRRGRSWTAGEDHFHRHLLDGHRGLNRLGWRRAIGASSDAPASFTRWDVERWAPGLCATCELVHTCPIEGDAARAAAELGLTEPLPGRGEQAGDRAAFLEDELAAADRRIASLVDRPRQPLDPDLAVTAGPARAEDDGRSEAVWLTAESLGDDDPALAARPGLPAVFVFDRPLLGRLRLTAKRFVFFVECLADLAERRELEVWFGDPVEVLAGRPLAATFTPVPGWRRRAAALDLAARYPWPWLLRPHDGAMTTYLDWLAEHERRGAMPAVILASGSGSGVGSG